MFNIIPTNEQLRQRLILLFFVLLAIQIMCRISQIWFLDILSHFQIQYFIISLFSLALTIWKKQLMLMCGFLLLTLSLGAPLAKYWLPKPHSNNVLQNNFSIASFNVNSSNQQKRLVCDTITKLNPDVMIILEVNAEWIEQLNKLQYPFKLTCPQPDNFGIAIYSKYPIDGSIEKFEGLPYIDCKIKGLEILGVHTLPPIGIIRFQMRNAELDFLAPKCKPNTVLVGDLNLTPFSPIFSSFLKCSDLKQSISGHGIFPTWNRGNPFVTLPLDHILVGKNIQVKEFTIKEACGSDHNLISAKLEY